jgi:NADH-quinone oxidoreductase subunit H
MMLSITLAGYFPIVFKLVLSVVGVIGFFAILGLFLVYAERKVAAGMQLRLGPNRVGVFGVAQTVADTIKLITKEGFTPGMADKFLFFLAPFIVIVSATLALAPIPIAKGWQFWNIDVGVIYVPAMASLSVIGVLMAGWASNNKYSLIGAMRSGAQIVSYELSVGLSLVSIVILTGSMNFNEIVMSQENGWWIFKGHIPVIISFVIFLIASTAEINRTPFDLPEAESELTAGFHTEYSGIQFAMFFLSEYVNMFIVSAVAATLFFGGWMPLHIGHWAAFNGIMDFIPGVIWFFGKSLFVIFLIMWFRWTFPRLRIDQLLNLEWKYLMPISLVNLLLVTLITIMGWHF